MQCFFSFVKAVGVCFMAVCEATYPTILAFSFLDDIQREFMVAYQSKDVQRAKRPYSFIEFGKIQNILHKNL
jgi:SEC22 vesicle trafficking protein A/C